jgi:c-di-GMP-binding flagellar brake protein YcgR
MLAIFLVLDGFAHPHSSMPYVQMGENIKMLRNKLTYIVKRKRIRVDISQWQEYNFLNALGFINATKQTWMALENFGCS